MIQDLIEEALLNLRNFCSFYLFIELYETKSLKFSFEILNADNIFRKGG